MEITLNVNIRAPELVKLFTDLVAQAGAGTHTGTRTIPIPAAKTAVVDAPADTPEPEAETTTRRGGRGKKADAPAAAASAAPVAAEPKSPAKKMFEEAAAAIAEGQPLTLEIVRNRLSDYSADKRYGMTGVVDVLKKFGVQRISDLPATRYEEFKKVLDDALAAPAGDPLA